MSVNRYNPEDWGGLHMHPCDDGEWVCYEAWEDTSKQLAALKEENERLKEYKNIALEFDKHRMNAIYLLKMVAVGNASAEDCDKFIGMPSPSAMEITNSILNIETENSKLLAIISSYEQIIHHDGIWKEKARLEIDLLKAKIADLDAQFSPVARLEQVYMEDEIQYSDDPSDFIVEWSTGKKFKNGEILYIKEPANEG